MMRWTKIDPNNLPEDEVIVTERLTNSFLVGHLQIGSEYFKGKVICEGEHYNVMEDPEYYILMSELGSLPFDE